MPLMNVGHMEQSSSVDTSSQDLHRVSFKDVVGHVSARFRRRHRHMCRRHKRAESLLRKWDRLPAKEKTLFERVYKLKPEERTKIIRAVRDHEFNEEMKKWSPELRQEYERRLESLKMKRVAFGWKERKFERKLACLRRKFNRRNSFIQSRNTKPKDALIPNPYYGFRGGQGRHGYYGRKGLWGHNFGARRHGGRRHGAGRRRKW